MVETFIKLFEGNKVDIKINDDGSITLTIHNLDIRTVLKVAMTLAVKERKPN